MGRPPGPEAGPRDHGRPRRGGNLDGRPSGCERVIVLHHRDFLLDNSNRKQQTVITALHLSLLLGLSWLYSFGLLSIRLYQVYYRGRYWAEQAPGAVTRHPAGLEAQGRHNSAGGDLSSPTYSDT